MKTGKPTTMKPRDLAGLGELALIRADVLDVLKTCGIEPRGAMPFSDDLPAIKRYIENLRQVLHWYASHAAYGRSEQGTVPVLQDGGVLARTALRQPSAATATGSPAQSTPAPFLNPGACAVREQSTAGHSLGRCWFQIVDGHCPHHGDVRAVQAHYMATGRLTNEHDLPWKRT